ncbi:MAG: hypothetical protein Q8N53_07490 [Longimicrobiales bacterium]|nr:hypothetical protein [Longimicrobiales bacterium]
MGEGEGYLPCCASSFRGVPGRGRGPEPGAGFILLRVSLAPFLEDLRRTEAGQQVRLSLATESGAWLLEAVERALVDP